MNVITSFRLCTLSTIELIAKIKFTNMKEIEITYKGVNLLIVGEYIEAEEAVYNYGGGDGYPAVMQISL